MPTYLYKRYPITGADFAGPRAALQRAGLTCHFVETDEDGAIETNTDSWSLLFRLIRRVAIG